MNTFKIIFLSFTMIYFGSSLPSSPKSPSEQYSAAAAASSPGYLAWPDQEQENHQRQELTSPAHPASSLNYQWPIREKTDVSALQEQINRQHQDNVNLLWQNSQLQKAHANLEKINKVQHELNTLLLQQKEITDPIVMKTFNQSQSAAYAAASGWQQAQPAAAAYSPQQPPFHLRLPQAQQSSTAAAGLSPQQMQERYQSLRLLLCHPSAAAQQPASAPSQQYNSQLQAYSLQLQQSQQLRNNQNKKAKRQRSSASAPAPRTSTPTPMQSIDEE
ncbi:MAG: hypothetical protein P4L31_01175 [Candidatus Babeliales bacterium]|nr:hypothetical protein [Candidatus Babeliales bacterium]